jgi:diadenosine tetraphosphate (Ap4A) HIT family hydrolase
LSQTLIHQFVSEASEGSLERAVAKLHSGWLCLGDPQVLPGYCVLYPDPVVATLNDLEGKARTQFLADMAMAGDAILEATGALRINYEILGNQEPALHAHLIPRYEWEDEKVRTRPVWFYDWLRAPEFSREDTAALRQTLEAAIQRRIGTDGPG